MHLVKLFVLYWQPLIVADVVNCVIDTVRINENGGVLVREDDAMKSFVGPTKTGIGGRVVYASGDVGFNFGVFGLQARFHDRGFDKVETFHVAVWQGKPDF